MAKQRITVGCRVDHDELNQIDAIAEDMGQSRAEWLYALIYRELHGTDLNTVKGLTARVSALESRLARLAR
ncbi:MAG: hypothetical protein HC866_17885 [Leptolyngbyaceae cyanobacterium RU_5_1]|nr:hypothetical protein [Leptolyngbyaceae cyanobacterium RU_5_1]